MTIPTRTAVSQDYDCLKNIFYEASVNYRSMRPDFYRKVGSLPPKWQFDFMLAAKKHGLFKDMEMIVAANAFNEPIGAIYMESVKRTPRSWSAFEKTAWIETLVIPRRTNELEDTLIEAGKEWARNTGHAYLNVKDLAGFKAHQEAYERAGLTPDYVIHGCHL